MKLLIPFGSLIDLQQIIARRAHKAPQRPYPNLIRPTSDCIITASPLNQSGKEDPTVQEALVKSMGDQLQSSVDAHCVSTVPKAKFWQKVFSFLNTNEIPQTGFNNMLPFSCLPDTGPATI